MNRKLHITNFIVVFAIAFALLFQSVHSVEHLSQIVTEKVCIHSPTNDKADITHHHHGLEKCTLCDFTFSSSLLLSPVKKSFIKIAFYYQSSFSSTSPALLSFSGSSYSLRGPPMV